jgi:phage shock protein PspC (stress-responsive transcriptional regulator)
MEKKLYRSATDKKIAGVCGGLAKYLNIDPTVIRVIWALIAVGGAGILAYIICALIIPEEPAGYIDAM